MNRLIVLEIDGLDIEPLLADDGLQNFRRLLDSGVYGRLLGDNLALDDSPLPYADFESVLDHVERAEDPLLHFLLEATAPELLDEQLGGLLERLDDRTAVLIHTPRSPWDGCFALAGPGVPALGERHDVSHADLAPAILRLAGHDPGHSSPLANLIGTVEQSEYTDEEAEAIIRERLSGLGYIG